MNTLERYIFRRAFFAFIGTLVVILAIVWTTQVLARINLVTDSGQSIGSFLYIATLILPAMFPEVVPFAVLIAIVQTLATMNNDSELVVVNAAGATRLTTIRPAMLIAVGAALCVFMIQNFVDPPARREFRDSVSAARADLLSTVVQEGVFRQVEAGLLVQVGERLRDGRLGSVFIVDTRQPGTELIYYAKEAVLTRVLERNMLLMRDGEVHRKTGSRDLSVIRYESYAFDLGGFAPSTGTDIAPESRNIFYLLNPDPNDRFYQQDPVGFRQLMHKRLTDWFYSITFALIGLAVAADARSHREARIHPLLTSIGIALCVRWAGFYSSGEAESTPSAVPFMYLVPLFASLLCLWLIATQRSLELPVWLTDRVAGGLQRLLRFANGLRPSGSGTPPARSAR